MILQKHLIRPVGSQLLVLPVVGALLLLALFWTHTRSRAIVAGVAGALIACAILNAGVSDLLRRDLLLGFERTASSFRALVQPALMQAANRAPHSHPPFSQF